MRWGVIITATLASTLAGLGCAALIALDVHPAVAATVQIVGAILIWKDVE